MKALKSEGEELVVGATLSALLYSYYTGYPLVYLEPSIPFRFDYFEPYFDLDKIVEQPEPREFITLDLKKKVGLPKRDMWERLYFILSLSGKIPYADKVKSVRIEEDINIITRKRNTFNCESVRIFDDKQVQGLSQKISGEEKTFNVYDWINVHSGTTHGLDFIGNISGSVIREVIFYPSDRIDGNHNKKDIVCVSSMTEEQLNDYRFSDTYVRFKVESLMKEVGIRGARNGRDQLNPEKYKYYALKLESAEREIRDVGLNSETDDDRVVLDSRTPEEIIKKYRGTKPKGYLGKIAKCLQTIST
tara:strand:+ start:804 stop:1715 length:912 start_codon:yes stop_codon:yes gene_type:complete